MEGGTQEEEEAPPLSNLRIVPGVVCVPNYWIVRQSQQEHPIQNPLHTCIIAEVKAEAKIDTEEPAGDAEASR